VIIERAGLADSKPYTTLVDTLSMLSSDTGDPISDPTHYRSLANALHYITFTCLDISCVVLHVCLHMHDLREPHMIALKHILLYLHGSLDFGLLLCRSSTSKLVVYFDADWAGCPYTHRSTSGYAVFLGDNLIYWFPKR
jgi:hypothetical protein